MQLNWLIDTKNQSHPLLWTAGGGWSPNTALTTNQLYRLPFSSVSIRPVLIITSLPLTFEYCFSALVEVSIMNPRVGKRQIVGPLCVHCWQSLAPFHPALPLKLTGSSTSFLSCSFEENRNGRLAAPTLGPHTLCLPWHCSLHFRREDGWWDKWCPGWGAWLLGHWSQKSVKLKKPPRRRCHTRFLSPSFAEEYL